MKSLILKALTMLCCLAALAGCDGNAPHKEAAEMLKLAGTQFEQGQYDKALATIDSLRKAYPDAVDARKAALRLYQEIELKRSQINVETADSILKSMKTEYGNMKQAVDALREKGGLTAENLSALTRMKLKVDSMQAVFDAECAKIRYIRKKMEE